MKRNAMARVMVAAFAAVILVGLAPAALSATLLKNYNDPNAGPLLVDWNDANYSWHGVSQNGWSDNATGFKNNGTAYASGVGMVSGAWSYGTASDEWWLDGRYTTFSGTVRMDDRTNSLAWAYTKLVGDGVTLATSGYYGINDSQTFTNVNVAGVKRLDLVTVNDGWGGRPVTYTFWSGATLTPDPSKPSAYYSDTLTAGTSSNYPGNAVTYNSATISGLPGGAFSYNSWATDGTPLTVEGKAVSGIGLRGAPWWGSSNSVIYDLTQSPTDGYRLFKFSLAPDTLKMSGYTDDSYLAVLVNGSVVKTINVGGWSPTWPYGDNSWFRTYSVDVTGGTQLELRLVNPEGGWGGSGAPYFVVFDSQFIANAPEPATLGLVALGAFGLILRRRA